jgi:hypothetical protein
MGTNLFAGTLGGGGVYLSTNSGTTWNQIGLNTYYINCLAVYGTYLLAGPGYGSIYLSSNSGISWIQSILTSSGESGVNAFAVSGTNIFAATYTDGVFLSTDSGGTWSKTGTSLFFLSLAVSPNGFLFAGNLYGVLSSSDNGASWNYTGLTNTEYVKALALSGTNLFAGTWGGGVFLTTNNGTSWSAVKQGLTSSLIQALLVSGSNLFAGTYNGGVFLSTDEGTSWNQINAGLTNTDVTALAISGTNLFAGTYGGGVWRRPLSEMMTSVRTNATELPNHFQLQQNFPNPFNPSTTIVFSLPRMSYVTLKVFNTLGQEIATLVNQRLDAGWQQVKWNANVSSAIYFYRLEARSVSNPSDHFVEAKKMVLMR